MRKQRDRPLSTRYRALILFVTAMVVLTAVGLVNSLNRISSNRKPSSERDPVTDVVPNPDIGDEENNVISPTELGTGIYADNALTYTYDTETSTNIFSYGASNDYNGAMIGAGTDENLYATISGGRALIGKNNAANQGQGALMLKSGNFYDIDKIVFETDFSFTTNDNTSDWFVRFALGYSYSGSIDNSTCSRIYLFGEDDSEYYSVSSSYSKPKNDFLLKKGEWYNLRMEYTKTSDTRGELTVYINGECVETVADQKNNGCITTYSCVYPELRYILGTAELRLDNTYMYGE